VFTKDRMVYFWYGRGKTAVRIVSQRERTRNGGGTSEKKCKFLAINSDSRKYYTQFLWYYMPNDNSDELVSVRNKFMAA